MASAVRPSASSALAAVRATTTRQARSLPRNVIRQQSRRAYSHSSSAFTSSSSSTASKFLLGIGGLGLFVAGGAGFKYTDRSPLRCDAAPSGGNAFPVKEQARAAKPSMATFEDYEKVYNAIAERLEEYDEYEDGSYGPVVLRLAWHASGTYEENGPKSTGGSNGATMRFDPESEHGANNGLKNARDFLEPIKGVCAVQEMQGPIVPWRPGRSDRDKAWCTPDGRLPDGSKEQNHLRRIFGRMGFNDQEIVALSGAHALGRCHVERSGFDGPWTFSPTVVTNDYFRLLVEEKWHIRDWDGERQWQDDGSNSLMMLPTDMALVDDSEFRPYVEKYARDGDAFFQDFSDALCKLFELGVPFEHPEEARSDDILDLLSGLMFPLPTGLEDFYKCGTLVTAKLLHSAMTSLQFLECYVASVSLPLNISDVGWST